jgi:hypothetical protein
METLFGLVWWAFVVGASWQAWKAWGAGAAFATLGGLYFAYVILPFGWLLTVGAAVAVGAKAEGAQQKQLAMYRS